MGEIGKFNFLEIFSFYIINLLPDVYLDKIEPDIEKSAYNTDELIKNSSDPAEEYFQSVEEKRKKGRLRSKESRERKKQYVMELEEQVEMLK